MKNEVVEIKIGLISILKRKLVITTDSNHAFPITKSLLDRNFTSTEVSNSLNTSSTVRGLKIVTKQRKYADEGLIHHSDRGLQYYGIDYQ